MVEKMNTYNSFTEAYTDLCRQIRDESEFDSSPRGLRIKEKLGVQFRITNARQRLPKTAARNFSLTYFVAETLWYLSGSNSTEWISRYAPFWKEISDDGKTANSAYGSRIFRPHPRIGGGKISQWDYVKEELHRDPDSRRAVIHIRTPDDSIISSKDVPCTLALQFFIRNERLHLHVNMRSSDIILGLAYDVPAFTTIQEILANELGIDLGEYVHTSNSLHCYERDFVMLNDIVEEGSNLHSAGGMAPYPKTFPIGELMDIERSINAMSEGEIRDGISPITSEIRESLKDPVALTLADDWSSILLSNRARKLKDEKLAKLKILQTKDIEYHFFKR